MNPYFVCLSLIVSGRVTEGIGTLTAMDCLAYAIERESEPEYAGTWMVRQAEELFARGVRLPHDA